MHDWSIQFQTNCEDGGKHDGHLELITWTGLENEEKLGFGGVTLDEADLLQSIFIKDFNGDEEAFYKEWPQAFRWTCCGSSGNLEFGCDHHGTGSTPCSCDFCISGHELPLDMVERRADSQSAKGLTLSKGPDPRSYNEFKARINAVMAGALRMEY